MQQDILKKEIDTLLDLKIIEPFMLEDPGPIFISPAMLVNKKDGTSRMVINY